uniref:ribonuclease H n=1 Tax=Hucho hucho TaxID=62062 RepID=A0A4W5MZA1_9TELE
MVKNRYPLPLIASTFEPLQGATIFSKLDTRNAYHLVRIWEGDQWKTAFNMASWHYEYLVMPFGLTNAPAVFQALVNNVLWDMLNRFVFVNLDGILVFSHSAQEHVLHVRQVLQCLLENQLYIKVEKCEFHRPTISFLGYIIAAGNIQMDPEKVRVVVDWPQPISRVQLQCFLGFANFYRRFIWGYSTRASPFQHSPLPRSHLRGLQLQTRCSRTSNTNSQTALLTIYPDPSLKFVVEVDASDVGVGAVLSQHLAQDQKLHPCTFLSHRLNPIERNYDVINRERLAVKMALEEGWHWLEGAEHPFILRTDHKNLEYLCIAKRLNSRQARWALLFTRFNFTVSYRPGSKNVKPDALSSLYCPTVTPSNPKTPLVSRLHSSGV